jgi:hypothetical protein
MCIYTHITDRHLPKELHMQSLSRSTITPLRSAVAVAFLALAAQAGAVNPASTDIWANSFGQSFGAPAASNSSTASSASWNGSTDIWANRFRQSFGPSQASAEPATACAVGSTDIWGNGFALSFPSQPSAGSAQLVGICQVEVNSVHWR